MDGFDGVLADPGGCGDPVQERRRAATGGGDEQRDLAVLAEEVVDRGEGIALRWAEESVLAPDAVGEGELLEGPVIQGVHQNASGRRFGRTNRGIANPRNSS